MYVRDHSDHSARPVSMAAKRMPVRGVAVHGLGNWSSAIQSGLDLVNTGTGTAAELARLREMVLNPVKPPVAVAVPPNYGITPAVRAPLPAKTGPTWVLPVLGAGAVIGLIAFFALRKKSRR